MLPVYPLWAAQTTALSTPINSSPTEDQLFLVLPPLYYVTSLWRSPTLHCWQMVMTHSKSSFPGIFSQPHMFPAVRPSMILSCIPACTNCKWTINSDKKHFCLCNYYFFIYMLHKSLGSHPLERQRLLGRSHVFNVGCECNGHSAPGQKARSFPWSSNAICSLRAKHKQQLALFCQNNRTDTEQKAWFSRMVSNSYATLHSTDRINQVHFFLKKGNLINWLN